MIPVFLLLNTWIVIQTDKWLFHGKISLSKALALSIALLVAPFLFSVILDWFSLSRWIESYIHEWAPTVVRFILGFFVDLSCIARILRVPFVDAIGYWLGIVFYWLALLLFVLFIGGGVWFIVKMAD